MGPAASISSLDEARRKRRLEELTREHGDYLRALARKLCRTQLDPEDLVQDLYERVLRSEMPEGANPRAWMSRVMNNLFIDKLRRRGATGAATAGFAVDSTASRPAASPSRA